MQKKMQNPAVKNESDGQAFPGYGTLLFHYHGKERILNSPIEVMDCHAIHNLVLLPLS